MRVLHVISTLYIGSGIANFVMSYYRKIIGYKVQFDFLAFCPYENGFEEEVKELGGNVYYIAKPNLRTAGQYKKAVKRFFKEHSGEWECVHIHEILVQKYIAETAKKVGGVKKVLIHSHASKFVLPEYGISPLKNKLKMFIKSVRNKVLLSGVKRNADFCVACSEDAGRALFGEKILEDKKFCVVKNAIETEKYRVDETIRERYRKEFSVDDKKVIMLVGRLSEEKNPLFMLDVFSEIHKVDKQFFLIFVGDGHMKKQIIDKAMNLGLADDILLTGNRTDVNLVLQCADIFVLPSLAEGLGIVLIEAQASGLSCIASTGVPKEAEITPNVRFMDLSDGAKHWAETILNTDLKRYDTEEYVKKSGYDISSNIEFLYEKYNSIVGN